MQHGGGGRKAAQARREAAAQAVKATGGFDTAVTSYETLLSLAKSQGAVGGDTNRGACKICGQAGHLTKQCRNQFSKYYSNGAGEQGAKAAAGDGTAAAAAGIQAVNSDGSDSDLDSLLGKNDSSGSSSDDSSEDERRRRKDKKRKRSSKSSRDKKHKKKKSRKEKKSKKSKKRRRHSSDSSDSD